MWSTLRSDRMFWYDSFDFVLYTIIVNDSNQLKTSAVACLTVKALSYISVTDLYFTIALYWKGNVHLTLDKSKMWNDSTDGFSRRHSRWDVSFVKLLTQFVHFYDTKHEIIKKKKKKFNFAKLSTYFSLRARSFIIFFWWDHMIVHWFWNMLRNSSFFWGNLICPDYL